MLSSRSAGSLEQTHRGPIVYADMCRLLGPPVLGTDECLGSDGGSGRLDRDLVGTDTHGKP